MPFHVITRGSNGETIGSASGVPCASFAAAEQYARECSAKRGKGFTHDVVPADFALTQAKPRLQRFPELYCRKCGTHNPFIYYGPVIVEGWNAKTKSKGETVGDCICEPCAKASNWLDDSGNIRKGYQI
jgi:hypothetical protein